MPIYLLIDKLVFTENIPVTADFGIDKQIN